MRFDDAVAQPPDAADLRRIFSAIFTPVNEGPFWVGALPAGRAYRFSLSDVEGRSSVMRPLPVLGSPGRSRADQLQFHSG
jgi:hypothetical protein